MNRVYIFIALIKEQYVKWNEKCIKATLTKETNFNKLTKAYQIDVGLCFDHYLTCFVRYCSLQKNVF